jgi:hypothetical protein
MPTNIKLTCLIDEFPDKNNILNDPLYNFSNTVFANIDENLISVRFYAEISFWF